MQAACRFVRMRVQKQYKYYSNYKKVTSCWKTDIDEITSSKAVISNVLLCKLDIFPFEFYIPIKLDWTHSNLIVLTLAQE